MLVKSVSEVRLLPRFLEGELDSRVFLSVVGYPANSLDASVVGVGGDVVVQTER